MTRSGGAHPHRSLTSPRGGIASEAEELELERLNDWVAERGLPRGQMAFYHADPETGVQRAVFDLVGEDGI